MWGEYMCVHKGSIFKVVLPLLSQTLQPLQCNIWTAYLNVNHLSITTCAL